MIRLAFIAPAVAIDVFLTIGQTIAICVHAGGVGFIAVGHAITVRIFNPIAESVAIGIESNGIGFVRCGRRLRYGLPVHRAAVTVGVGAVRKRLAHVVAPVPCIFEPIRQTIMVGVGDPRVGLSGVSPAVSFWSS